MKTVTMDTRMHWICSLSILICGLLGGNYYASAQVCTSIPLSDPIRVVATPPLNGPNYAYFELVTLSCNSSGEYTFTGNDYTYCEGNNQWNPDPSTVICYEKCADNLLPAGVIQVDADGATKSYYEHGEYIYLSCSGSQTLIGPNRVTCLDGSIGDVTVLCEGGTTTIVYTTTHATTTSAPSTTTQQDRTTLDFQTIFNTATGATTPDNDSLSTQQPGEATEAQTNPLTSIEYITSNDGTTVEISTMIPTDLYATTVQQSTSRTLTENITEATEALTDIPTSTSASTDVYEGTTFQTVFSTDFTGGTMKTDSPVTVTTPGSSDEATVAVTEETVTFSTSMLATDVNIATTIQTEFITDLPESTSATDYALTDFTTEVVTEVATEFATETDTYPATTMQETKTTPFTELPQTDGNIVTTLTTGISVTDDDVTTSPIEATEVVSTLITVTEVVTEMDDLTSTMTTAPLGTDMTTMMYDPCEGFCDPGRERCLVGLDGPECVCLPGFYRITEDRSETDVQCTEAILFEVDARITEIDGQTVEFSEDLNNSSSPRFIYLDDLICTAASSIQDSLSDFLVCQVASFSNGSIIAAIELYFDELSNATEVEVFNETISVFEENNITAEVTRVELMIPSISTTAPSTTKTQTSTTATTDHDTTDRTTLTTRTTPSRGTEGATQGTKSSTTQFVTTAQPTNSITNTTLIVLYVLIPVLAVILLIAIGVILYQNKKVSDQYGVHNPRGKKPKEPKNDKKSKGSKKEMNTYVNTAFYDGIKTSADKATQTPKPQPSDDDRPDSGVVVSEDVDHMVYPFPGNEPDRHEDVDDAKVIYAKVDRKSVKDVTHKNPPVIVEIELKPVVVDEPQSAPVDWAAVDPEHDTIERETSVSEAVTIESDHNDVDDQADDSNTESLEMNNTGSQTEVDDQDEEPNYIAIGGFELKETSSNQGSTSKEGESIKLDSISLELTSTMESELDRRFSYPSSPC
ncbi:uncharacterized protein LOC129275966 [Lytechinus pictus]|uniref:uncharacterized protein LOC129275966 n=1 Tax=Lytechinus pictus TaxID=7653 RepID=UPI0030B9FA26